MSSEESLPAFRKPLLSPAARWLVLGALLLVGAEQTRPIAEGVRSTTFDASRLHVFDTLKEAVSWTQTNLAPGDTVLYLNDLPDTY